MLSKTQAKRLHPDFEVQTYQTASGKEQTRAMPKTIVPVPVSVGMAVEYIDNGAARTGTVHQMLPDFVIVHGQRGETVVLMWGEVKLLGARRPD
jgi:hypothetical protein